MGQNKYSYLVKLNEYENNRLNGLIDKTGCNRSDVIRKLITKTRLHEKPPDDLYDLLYGLNKLTFDIECLLKRIDSRTATAEHLESVTEEIDTFRDHLSKKYLY